MFDGSQETDEYLSGWSWGEYTQAGGTPAETAAQLANRYNQCFPEDFVMRIQELHESGERRPKPGAADRWME